MNDRRFGYGVLVATAGEVVILALIPALAQRNASAPKSPCVGCSVDGKTTPRASDGHPDLSGFWNNPDPLGHISSRDLLVFFWQEKA